LGDNADPGATSSAQFSKKHRIASRSASWQCKAGGIHGPLGFALPAAASASVKFIAGKLLKKFSARFREESAPRQRRPENVALGSEGNSDQMGLFQKKPLFFHQVVSPAGHSQPDKTHLWSLPYSKFT